MFCEEVESYIISKKSIQREAKKNYLYGHTVYKFLNFLLNLITPIGVLHTDQLLFRFFAVIFKLGGIEIISNQLRRHSQLMCQLLLAVRFTSLNLCINLIQTWPAQIIPLITRGLATVLMTLNGHYGMGMKRLK